MSRKKRDEYLSTDPIALEQRERERMTYYESLFLPMLVGVRNDLDWLVEGILPKGFLVMLASPPKTGKTCLATAIALAVATGTPFAGHNTSQAGVLWISGEENPVERQLIFKHSPLADPATPIYTCYQKVAIDDEDFLDALDHWVSQTRAKLIVVDSLLACCTGRTLQDSHNARRTLQPLKDFCSLRGITALVLHHAKRAEGRYGKRRVADNDQLSAASSMSIVLRSQHASPALTPPMSSSPFSPPLRGAGGCPNAANPESHAPRLVTLYCQGRGVQVNRTFNLLSYGPLDYRDTDVLTPGPNEKEKPTRTELAIIEALMDGPLDSEQIIARTHIPAGTIRNTITNLRRNGKIEIVQVQGMRRIYALVENVRNCRKQEKSILDLIRANPDYGQHPMTMF